MLSCSKPTSAVSENRVRPKKLACFAATNSLLNKFQKPPNTAVSLARVPRPTYHTATKRRFVMRKTSEHWYEEEEEFDGVGGEVLLPKTLLVVGLPREEVSPEAAAAVAAAMGVNGSTLAAGFCAEELQAWGSALWTALGAGGPPFFKRMRTRATLDALHAVKTPEDADSATDAVMSELLSQNWRVELDYGLGGAELAPREEVVVVCSREGLGMLLQGFGSNVWRADAALAEDPGPLMMCVDVGGWNTEVKPEDMKPLRAWRDLCCIKDFRPLSISE